MHIERLNQNKTEKERKYGQIFCSPLREGISRTKRCQRFRRKTFRISKLSQMHISEIGREMRKF